MKFVPFVAQVEHWKRAFSPEGSRANGRWLVGQKGEGTNSPPIKLVTPTQQAVERAKSEIKRMRMDNGGESDVKKKKKKTKTAPKKMQSQLKRFKRK